jgi:hypothetical protein
MTFFILPTASFAASNMQLYAAKGKSVGKAWAKMGKLKVRSKLAWDMSHVGHASQVKQASPKFASSKTEKRFIFDP